MKENLRRVIILNQIDEFLEDLFREIDVPEEVINKLREKLIVLYKIEEKEEDE